MTEHSSPSFESTPASGTWGWGTWHPGRLKVCEVAEPRGTEELFLAGGCLPFPPSSLSVVLPFMLGWPGPGEVPDGDRRGATVGPGSGGVCRGRRELGGQAAEGAVVGGGGPVVDSAAGMDLFFSDEEYLRHEKCKGRLCSASPLECSYFLLHKLTSFTLSI